MGRFPVEDFLISMAASVLLKVIEDRTRAKTWQRLLVKLFRSISINMANDPEVRDIAKAMSKG
jgi:hypothetical protein